MATKHAQIDKLANVIHLNVIRRRGVYRVTPKSKPLSRTINKSY